METCPFDLGSVNSAHGADEAYSRLLADHGPVFATDDLGGYVAVIGYDEVRAAAVDARALCSSQGATIPRLGINRALPTESDDPEHRDYRRLMQPELTQTRVAIWEDRIAEVADQALDEIIESGRGDLRELAERIPALLIADVLGTPGRGREMVMLTNELNHAAGRRTPEADDVRRRFGAFIEELVSAAETDPDHPGLLGHIARAEIAGEKVTHQQAMSLTTTLVVAGQETTVNGISTMLWLVASHPEIKARLLADRSLVKRTVEEALRVESPVTMMGRTATAALQIAGAQIDEGQKVGLFFGAANLDERAFPRPGEFDIDRAGAAHVAFGHGVHRCVGEHLARLEMKVALERVLERIPDLQLDGDVVIGTSFAMNRGITALPVRFEPRSRSVSGIALPAHVV